MVAVALVVAVVSTACADTSFGEAVEGADTERAEPDVDLGAPAPDPKLEPAKPAPDTTEPTPDTTEPTPTPEVTSSTLPLVPTTSTTVVDRSVDPPAPVADPPGPPGRNSVLVVGDSVLIGTASVIPIELSEWSVTYDAVGSRRLAQAVDLFEQRRDEIGEAVVIHLGNNYIAGERGDYASQIDEVMGSLWWVPRVVWVTLSEVSPTRAQMNVQIHEAAERWPNMRVADWASLIAANPDWSWDGLHLAPEGRRALAELISETLGPVDEPVSATGVE